MSGQGVDRLLFGLQKIAEETSGVVPDVFQTGALAWLIHSRIRAREWGCVCVKWIDKFSFFLQSR